ncbi:MAG: aldo/keto reductase, partial [Staphylococcus lugdunensis]|nr:aldo/keto reductase [Staphylococcus lugdunensis]
MKTREFYNGQAMPKVGLGTFRIGNNNECQQAVQYAIEQGYRSIDKAKVYGNEE